MHTFLPMAASEKSPCGSQENFEMLYDEFLNSFFDKHNIKRTLGILFNRSKNSVNDCISSVLKQICTESVQLNFTEHGFCPFKNEPFLTIPFEKMSQDQLLLVHNAIKHCDASKHFMACSQMGMGASIFMLENSHSQRHVEISIVLLGLYQLIKSSSDKVTQKIDVYNVMTQRLLKSVRVNPELMIQAQALCLEYDRRAEN